jgi:hypothetical protein
MSKGVLKKQTNISSFSVVFYRFNTRFLSVSYSQVNRTSLSIAKKRKGVENYSHISFSVSVRRTCSQLASDRARAGAWRQIYGLAIFLFFMKKKGKTETQ